MNASARSWPSGPAGLLLAAPRIAWYPDTLLGRAGMDYGLFDSVVDGRKLISGDTAAFFAMLAAVREVDPEALAAVIGQIQASAPPNQTVPDEAMMQADILRRRQEAAAMAGAGTANALQSAPLGQTSGMTIRSLLSGLLASAGVR
jgi:hypothetical protein